MGLSIRAYARHRGVSHAAVIKAIDSGRITPEPDGTIDPDRADLEWSRNTISPRRKIGRHSAQSSRAHVNGAQQSPMNQVGEVEVPSLESGGTSLLQVRTVNELLKAKLRQVELEEKKEKLVDKAKAVAHVFKLARAERDAWLNWPNRVVPMLAAKLGVDEHTLHVALDAAVREHLAELGDVQVKVGS